MKAVLKRFGIIYLSVANAYGLWVLVLLNFKECGMFGTACTPFFTQVVSAIIAAVRGITWLPEMIISLLRGQFLDWLFCETFMPRPFVRLCS